LLDPCQVLPFVTELHSQNSSLVILNKVSIFVFLFWLNRYIHLFLIIHCEFYLLNVHWLRIFVITFLATRGQRLPVPSDSTPETMAMCHSYPSIYLHENIWMKIKFTYHLSFRLNKAYSLVNSMIGWTVKNLKISESFFVTTKSLALATYFKFFFLNLFFLENIFRK